MLSGQEKSAVVGYASVHINRATQMCWDGVSEVADIVAELERANAILRGRMEMRQTSAPVARIAG